MRIGFSILMHTMATSTASFETALGRCAVRWSATGITGVLLPSPTIARLALPDEAIPGFVRRAIDGMTAVLAGSGDPLLDVPIDHLGVDGFRRAVYRETRRTMPGTTRSYGDVARAMGLDRLDGAREVGAALARNPTPILVPCHRVVSASGALHGFSAPGGLATKRRMLELEGAPGFGQQVLFD